jgi:anti-sigma factor RsiW
MNCRDAERQIFAERDGALDTSQRAALTEHVAHCAACRDTRNHLAAAIESWRHSTQAVVSPDPVREWEALRRQIRGGVSSVAQPSRRRNVIPWLALPIGAAAAVAVALFVNRPEPSANDVRQVARADAVEVSAGAGSVVVVDDKSGWVVIWEGDAPRI